MSYNNRIIEVTSSVCFILLLVINIHANNKIPNINTNPISLKEILIIAQNEDLELKKLKFNKKLFNIEQKESIKNFYPQITSKLTKSNSSSFNNPSGTTIFTFQNSVRLPIYDRTIIYNNYKAKNQIILNSIRIKKRLNDLYKEISTLYYTILSLKNIVKIRNEEYNKALKIHNLAKIRLKLKKAVILDVLLTKGLVIQSKNNIISANNDLHRKQVELLHRLNIKNSIKLLDNDNITMSKNIPFNDLVTKSTNERWDIKEKYYEIKVTKELYEIEKSLFYPKITLLGDVKFLGNNKIDFTSRNEWSVFVTVSMALLDDVNVESEIGTRKYSNAHSVNIDGSVTLKIFDRKLSKKLTREQYKNLYKSISAEAKDLKFKIKQELLEAYHKSIESKNKVELAQLNIEIGKGLFKKAEVEYTLGKKGMEDVIEAKEKEIAYKMEYQQSKLEYKLSMLNLKWASGSLWREPF